MEPHGQSPCYLVQHPCGATFRSHNGAFLLPMSIGGFPAAGIKLTCQAPPLKRERCTSKIELGLIISMTVIIRVKRSSNCGDIARCTARTEQVDFRGRLRSPVTEKL